jgi:hypothetical protein
MFANDGRFAPKPVGFKLSQLDTLMWRARFDEGERGSVAEAEQQVDSKPKLIINNR